MTLALINAIHDLVLVLFTSEKYLNARSLTGHISDTDFCDFQVHSKLIGYVLSYDYFSYAGTWTDKYKDKDERRIGTTTNQLPSSRDYLGDFLVWRPPIGLEKNGAFWAALTFWLGLVGAVIFLQR